MLEKASSFQSAVVLPAGSSPAGKRVAVVTLAVTVVALV